MFIHHSHKPQERLPFFGFVSGSTFSSSDTSKLIRFLTILFIFIPRILLFLLVSATLDWNEQVRTVVQFCIENDYFSAILGFSYLFSWIGYRNSFNADRDDQKSKIQIFENTQWAAPRWRRWPSVLTLLMLIISIQFMSDEGRGSTLKICWRARKRSILPAQTMLRSWKEISITSGNFCIKLCSSLYPSQNWFHMEDGLQRTGSIKNRAGNNLNWCILSSISKHP